MNILFAFFLGLFNFLPPPAVASPVKMEICDNAVDDDGDGLIDLNDSDCDCPLVEPVSLIPNPSFEEMECCPSSRSQLHCATTWIQASEATTDYLHQCGWMGWPDLPVPLPLPDGQACIGFRNGRYGNESRPNWKEYTGACLLGPLRANSKYRIEFHVGFTDYLHSPATQIVFFGSTDCDNLPFGTGDEDFGCPTNGPGWIQLGTVNISGVNSWRQVEINLTPPVDIHAIAIGPNCAELYATDDIYYFFDNLVLAEESLFEFRISDSEQPCAEDFTLQVPLEDTLTYQWYKDGIALIGETDHQLIGVKENGRYEVKILGPSSCQLIRPYFHERPFSSTQIEGVLCKGETFQFNHHLLVEPGVYFDTLKTVENCDSIIELNLLQPIDDVDSLFVKIFRGEHHKVGRVHYDEPGEFLTTLISADGCDSLVYLNLDYYDVFMPNAFSPNLDGINDYFTIFGGTDLTSIKTLQIFDRWGGLVFEAGDLLPGDESQGWNGQFRGKPMPTGIYTYLTVLEMESGREKLLSGSVLLVR